MSSHVFKYEVEKFQNTPSLLQVLPGLCDGNSDYISNATSLQVATTGIVEFSTSQSPESRVQSPESRVQSPESRLSVGAATNYQ
ncbi:predicted protein [Botrytis cinerea T4]|uniref:Uncharacterized protein n=1 Tax=Botryotinia fuckeliana (strain T4) TaxID=999810 RepID=G2Y3K9_BOTF4|nr:predicted protein [Botrytis cinerea T4]